MSGVSLFLLPLGVDQPLVKVNVKRRRNMCTIIDNFFWLTSLAKISTSKFGSFCRLEWTRKA